MSCSPHPVIDQKTFHHDLIPPRSAFDTFSCVISRFGLYVPTLLTRVLVYQNKSFSTVNIPAGILYFIELLLSSIYIIPAAPAIGVDPPTVVVLSPPFACPYLPLSLPLAPLLPLLLLLTPSLLVSLQVLPRLPFVSPFLLSSSLVNPILIRIFFSSASASTRL
ncbi:hypothetical protein AX774_g7006 [Zancudomyces culisetae]|uniref:Uncharacterized protein n=1 Tax=Zancudomyces culisetae TaxID=1213189 RepID=A0A1R1PF91_ZANCU|nr:hypothetical protein AX774_g7006 [Zancudomyces culisetae]|eukprot:OMH79573.1 hypothetical protein AX774_g7006 [Zancudomyces culisetae]